jgi:hypothetical protein
VITAVARDFDELPPKAFILFIGAHSEGLELTRRLLAELPGFLSGLYIQVGPTAPVTDSPTKLLRLSELYRDARRLGLPVIAGHAGAITPELRAAGIDATDAGLASGEAFESSSARRPTPPTDAASDEGGGPASRMYLEAVGRSFNAKRVAEMRSVAAVSDLLGGCHRFIAGDDYLSRAREHSLRARIAEAEAIARLPGSMRLPEMIEVVTRRRSTVTSVNAGLKAKGIQPLDTRPADNHLNWLGRLFEQQPAA